MQYRRRAGPRGARRRGPGRRRVGLLHDRRRPVLPGRRVEGRRHGGGTRLRPGPDRHDRGYRLHLEDPAAGDGDLRRRLPPAAAPRPGRARRPRRGRASRADEGRLPLPEQHIINVGRVNLGGCTRFLFDLGSGTPNVVIDVPGRGPRIVFGPAAGTEGAPAILAPDRTLVMTGSPDFDTLTQVGTAWVRQLKIVGGAGIPGCCTDGLHCPQ